MAGALNLLKALVEPVRIRLYLLMKQSALTVSELSEILEISQSNTSHHVKALRDLGLLSAEKTGQHTYYALNSERIQEKSVVAILHNLEEIGSEIPELHSDAAKLRTVLAARSGDTFAQWRMEQPDLPYTDIFAHLACGRRGVVADIGCGEGDFFESLSLSFDRVVALDLELKHVRRARTRASQQIFVTAANAQQLPFVDGVFDAVVLRMALSQMPAPLIALDEALRVLKKGGYISLIDQAARGRGSATAKPVLSAVEGDGALVADLAKPGGDTFRATLLNHLSARRDIFIDTERSLPRLFMLRAQKV